MSHQRLIVEFSGFRIVHACLDLVGKLIGQHVKLAGVLVYSSNVDGVSVAQKGGQGLMHPEFAGFIRNKNSLLIAPVGAFQLALRDRKSTRLNSSHVAISYAVFCLKKKRWRTRG